MYTLPFYILNNKTFRYIPDVEFKPTYLERTKIKVTTNGNTYIQLALL